MPKVSIVLPTYNGEKYIKESIESVIRQTFSDWELIVVNDCSNDGTSSIVREYVSSDNRIHMIDNAVNQKLPRSLNIGFGQAKGKYLTWTSDDNYYLPEAIERMVGYLESHREIYLVCTAMQMIDEDGVKLDRYVPYSEERMYYNDCVGACFMYRREVLDEIGDYDPKLFLVEDYDYWMRILFRYGTIGFIPECHYIYRMSAAGLTMTRSVDIRKQLQILRKKNIIQILGYFEGCRPDLICEIYYQMADVIGVSDDLKEKFWQTAPILKKDVGYKKDKKVVIYGAGDYGNRAFKKLNGNVEYYVDSDIGKVGRKKNGVRIISLEEMLTLGTEYQVLVAIYEKYIYEILRILEENNIDTWCVYQSMKY